MCDLVVSGYCSYSAVAMARNSLSQPTLFLAWFLITISSLVIAGRFYTRIFHLKSVRIDDYLMLAAWVFALYNTILVTVAIHNGLGFHVDQVRPNLLGVVSLDMILIKFPSVFSTYLSRISFSATLLLITRNTNRKKVRAVVWTIIAAETFFTFFVIFQMYLQCGRYGSELITASPLHAQRCVTPLFETYLGYIQSGMRPDQTEKCSFADRAAGVNSLADLILASIPFVLIHSYNLPPDVKRWCTGLALLGFVAFAASTAKVVQIQRIGVNGDFTCTWFAPLFAYSILIRP